MKFDNKSKKDPKRVLLKVERGVNEHKINFCRFVELLEMGEVFIKLPESSGEDFG